MDADGTIGQANGIHSGHGMVGDCHESWVWVDSTTKHRRQGGKHGRRHGYTTTGHGRQEEQYTKVTVSLLREQRQGNKGSPDYVHGLQRADVTGLKEFESVDAKAVLAA